MIKIKIEKVKVFCSRNVDLDNKIIPPIKHTKKLEDRIEEAIKEMKKI